VSPTPKPTPATGTSVGARINLQYRALERLSHELVDIATAVEQLKQPLLTSVGTLATTTFGLVAESGDAFMAYRKRVAAFNTEAEATEAELVGMSDVLTTTVTDFRKHSAATATSLEKVQRSLDQPVTASGTPATPEGMNLTLDWDLKKK
jgi:hypothetical protein